MTTLAVLYAASFVAAWCAFVLLCRLIDHVTDWRRLRRLSGATVIRLPLPSPDRRGECVPRLAAVQAHHRIRP